MKRSFLVVTALIIVGTAAIIWHVPVKAQSTPMTEAHINRIRANCIDAQSVLTQLHASDALLRVNRGQVYESIATKLMAPFNSRVTLNKYDSSKLISQSAKYETLLNEFRVNYKSYDEAITKALRINCMNEPVAFYDSVGEARTKRMLVHQTIVKLKETIQGYKTEFEAFAATLKEGQ